MSRFAIRGRGTRGVVGTVALLVVAEAVLVVLAINPAYLPRVSTVLTRTVGLFGDIDFLTEVGNTVLAWLEGLAIAALAGLAIGVILGRSRVIRTSAQSIIEFIRPIPSVALIPLGIVALGQGDRLRLALIVYAATWPVMYNVMTALRELDSGQLDTAKVFAISRYRRLTNVLWHNILPHFTTGVRIAAPLALILTISAEMLGASRDGLGVWILEVSEGTGRPDLVLAGTIVAGLLGVASNWLIVVAERRLLPWHPLYRSRIISRTSGGGS